MRSASSRKGQTSITHLMNFALPPRPEYHPPYRSGRRYASWGLGSGYHAMDKARYVHANYRFIVDPRRSYHAQAVNADVHLDWDSVMQVLVSAQTQASSCPICLSIPVAPRMAKCGHIFCLPCLIRYMHSSDHEENPVPGKKARWQKCPICWDTIYISETRPVRWFTGQEGDLPVEGGDVVLRLMKREPGSTLALPRDGAEDLGLEDDIPWYHAAEVSDYARIMKGGEDYMMVQYDAEIESLRAQEMEDEVLFGDDTTWTRRAVASITSAKERTKGIGNPPDVTRKPPAKKEPILFNSLPDTVAAMYTSQHATKSGKSSSTESILNGQPPTSMKEEMTDNLQEAVGALDLGTNSDTKAKQKDGGTPTAHSSHHHHHHQGHPFYFYQALPQFYLSSLDIRILKAAFGDYSLFPATILPRVERISTGHVIDDELRKRAKYLGHLPQGCEVNFLECDWRDVVAAEVLEQFQPDIERRRRRNREKDTREEKDRIRAETEESKRWVAVRRNKPDDNATNSTTPFSAGDFQPLSGSTENEPSALGIGSSSSAPAQGGVDSVPGSPSGTTRTVWGTAAVPPADSEHEEETTTPTNDGWRQGWEEELLARQESELMARSMGDGTHPSGSGKKKKNKKITLMSTNIQRGA